MPQARVRQSLASHAPLPNAPKCLVLKLLCLPLTPSITTTCPPCHYTPSRAAASKGTPAPVSSGCEDARPSHESIPSLLAAVLRVVLSSAPRPTLFAPLGPPQQTAPSEGSSCDPIYRNPPACPLHHDCRVSGSPTPTCTLLPWTQTRPSPPHMAQSQEGERSMTARTGRDKQRFVQCLTQSRISAKDKLSRAHFHPSPGTVQTANAS